MEKYSFLNAVHPEHIEELYHKYLEDSDVIEPTWKSFFQGFDFFQENYVRKKDCLSSEISSKEFKVIDLINASRTRGHFFALKNPLLNKHPEIALDSFGLSEEDLDTVFKAPKIIGLPPTSLKKILKHLKTVFCESIGIEYMHIHDVEKIEWIQKWINYKKNHPQLSFEKKKLLFEKLSKAVLLEDFLHTKFIGHKRFSIEGNESLVPALYELVEYASDFYKVENIVFGMAHRGRLNVLSNLFKKNFSKIFIEFLGKEYENSSFSGDVKYHLGLTTIKKSRRGNSIQINMTPNPSHLEVVGAIVEGISRAKIDLHYAGDSDKVLPIIIHGDAAISAQGIVYEVVQISFLKGYKTGGTIHLVINNQVGFTTNYFSGRSSIYCTDIAKVLLSPVLHVNSEDMESVIHAIRFSVDFRMRYHQDVFIDLLGYRKYGHNESDEPRFTQKSLYRIIAKKISTKESYRKKLEKEGVIDSTFRKKVENNYKKSLEKSFEESKKIEFNKLDVFMSDAWKRFSKYKKVFEKIDTRFCIDRLCDIGKIIFTLPLGRNFSKKTERLFDHRYQIVSKEKRVDWGIAELLAYGSLLDEGYHIRVSGEDVERGTFSHRHSLIKSEDEEPFILLNYIRNGQGKIQVYNSPLSEYGVLGFDFGYSITSPNTLTIWEAQFGDFSNVGQVIIDQYISSAEEKWKIQSGLVLFLPHGYEGQGAEHSSARVERFLQLCSDKNILVANCSTPANFFHLLRRQMKVSFRKPLIVFTPKSLLRHSLCSSSLEELANGFFKEILDDDFVDPQKVRNLIFCSGKIYYDLFNKRKETLNEKTAIIRFEQLYPLKRSCIEKILKRYPSKNRMIWVQEEPENMGAWSYLIKSFREFPWELISPKESSVSSTGSYQNFLKIQVSLLEKAFQ